MPREVPISTRELVVKLWKGDGNACPSVRDIGSLLKLPKSTVFNIIKKYKETNSLANCPGRGRKPILTPREKRNVVRKIKKDPFKSAPKIAAEVKEDTGKAVSSQTVRNILKKEGFKAIY